MAGDTRTSVSSIAAVTLMGVGGRGVFERSCPESSPPQATTSSISPAAAITALARTRANLVHASLQRAVHAVRARAYDTTSDARRRPARPAARRSGVPRRGHGDERAAARALRAHRGGRRAGRRRRAARPLELARGRLRAARPRHPALHGHHAGDGRRRPAAGLCAARARGAPARARPGRPLGALRRRGAAAGVRAGRTRVARASGAVHGRARAPVRAAPAPARAGHRSPTRSGSRSRPPTARCRTRRHARGCCARCCRGSPPTRARWGRDWRCCGRAGRHGRAGRRGRGGRATSVPISPACRRTLACTSSATRTAGRCTSESRCACAPAHGPTSRRRWRGRARPSTSTTSRRSPSSARSCSRTG